MKLSDSVLKRRVFNKGIYDLHRKDIMLGQTTPHLSKLKILSMLVQQLACMPVTSLSTQSL